jgi:aerobic-type carbon monoxide dehydrogenase small subunit (CoxS/CutS family)
MDSTLNVTVNGQAKTVVTDPQRPLLDVLREEWGLLGAKYGCGEGKCGACSVIVDGERKFSCRVQVEDVAGKKVTTIEGIGTPDKLHPVQQAFLAEGAFQCGFCTPGMVVAAVALLSEKPRPTEAEILAGMNRNLCRCCSYVSILKAVKRAAAGEVGHE